MGKSKICQLFQQWGTRNTFHKMDDKNKVTSSFRQRQFTVQTAEAAPDCTQAWLMFAKCYNSINCANQAESNF